MKNLYVFFAFLLFSLNSIAGPKDLEEFNTEFSGKISIDGNDLYIQRIIHFPGLNQDDIMKKVKLYISDRIERKETDRVSNSDITYNTNSIILTETKRNLSMGKLSGGKFYGSVEYVYKFEVKDERIRATMFISGYHYGNFDVSAKVSYPFNEKTNKPYRKTMKNLLQSFYIYATETFDNVKAVINSIEKGNSVDEW